MSGGGADQAFPIFLEGDAPAVAAPQPASVSRWQALRERWALVRAKVATWWAGAARWSDHALGNYPFIALGAVAVGVLLGGLALWALSTTSKPAPVATATNGVEVVERALNDLDHQPIAPKVIEQILLDHDDRLLALESKLADLPGAAAGSTPAARRAAPQPRATAARPVPVPQAMPQSAPAGQESQPWGETDLDRAIAEFDPATATPKTTTNGAQP